MAKKKEVQVFEYEGKRITFDFGDGQKMVNATEMAKAFGKRVSNFTRLNQTKDFIKVLESRYSDVSNGNVYKASRRVQGGIPELQGTWFDEKLALKFAAWLNSEFELWVWERIYELLSTGKTELNTKPVQRVDTKTLEFVFQKIKDNAMEIHNLSDILDDLKKLED